MSNESNSGFTHINETGQPAMVDISGKHDTYRIAVAESRIFLPAVIREQFQGQDIQTRKGSVFQTAIIAGIMGAKKTPELIPLCHGILLDGCDIQIQLEGEEAVIRCAVKTTGKTGVEMEALTGASIAALTIYDMCKALSQEMVIRETKLISKSGGKHDFSK
ncbi:cyclic pyranopterin phosphate synthase [Chitinophaga terrae (ex Kim and Jung 2007)]|uniref:cyclic pyranopterin monophosphate synthase n=1 Tax=Chitinophaga terrae (ex Kim and Jung 2007) TaxID=408074 RepID=A0A1H4CSU2_9BACT|nr:cyclic pyranopterin monophosphate synthase MoaC [Chitinophaga terrae (ex Kim and Jung 2007)]MDQ0105256.1 cyclic pyranopterin phosphate synthase [Chitinophaga terrae (ex Kim and Jung 2007)]GEP90439.1 cyclic pyranopterin monophosphate synthase accessory protein [Chitinophaga terrae (ex Kim and Jung 2007)]SEA63426.1 cyclic pyranopterin phosphate synthase [Chitinophaga terrae (ex Kim and Jung 2007)]